MHKRLSPLHLIVSVPVIAAICAACWLTIMAVHENMRFSRSVDQTLTLAGRARNLATMQPDFGAVPNEDLIAAMQRAGQMAPGVAVTNGWALPVRAYAMPGGLMRVDNELPPHECRRLALYLIDGHPNESGIRTIAGYNRFAGRWIELYPATRSESTLELACQGATATLGVVFQYR